MIWLQAVACFVAWTAYGLLLRRSSDRIRSQMHSASRGKRVFLGSAGLLIGLGVLALGLWLVGANGGLGADGLKPWAWLAVAAVGFVFVHLQVLGAAAMVSLVIEEETARRRRSSAFPEKEQK